MTNTELHIALEQKFNRADLETFHDLSTEQKDYWLNVGMSAFLKERVKPQPYWPYGFEEVRFQYEGIDSLINHRVEIPLYIDGTNIFKGILPDNLYATIAESCSVEWNCNGVQRTINSFTKYIAVLPFPDDSAVVAPYYNNFRISILFDDTSEDFVLTESIYTGYGTGVSHKSYKYFLINYFRDRFEKLNQLENVEVYWEKYDNLYHENSFIIVYADDGVKVPLTLRYYINGVEEGTRPFTSVIYNKYAGAAGVQHIETDCRLIRHNQLYDVLNHSFQTTKYDSLIITKQGKVINVYVDESFNVLKLYLTYVRRPRLIDSAVQQSCELDEAYHETVVNMTVDKLTAAFATQTHQLIKSENLFNR